MELVLVWLVLSFEWLLVVFGVDHRDNVSLWKDLCGVEEENCRLRDGVPDDKATPWTELPGLVSEVMGCLPESHKRLQANRESEFHVQFCVLSELPSRDFSSLRKCRARNVPVFRCALRHCSAGLYALE